LIRLAWVNVAIHVLALVLALVGLRPGSPLVELPERMDYLAGFPLAWSLGWGSWMLCTLALIAFFAVLAHRLPERAATANLAVILAAAGGGIDLFCDVIYITVLPQLATATPPSRELFLMFERVANAGGLVVANGLYALATLLLTLCLRQPGPRMSLVVGTGYGVFGFGMVLVLAGFLNDAWLAALGTGPTIGLFCVWTVLAARRIEHAEGEA
jgi:hypothetical protein